MGLDMYAYRAPAAMVGDAQIDLNNLLFEDGNAKPGVDTDFAYWRKFNALHGWMEDLWRKKGGQGTFNCTTVRLTPDDILDLELSIDIMEPRGGFFFGPQTYDQDDKDSVRAFIAKAREAFAAGDAVFYNSWW